MNATTTVKQVRFAKLEIHNFKGTKELVVNFSDDMTIGGANRTGKSTFFDAITWCLFGKNSQDKQDFNIKNTTDTSLNRADHSVELTMSIDGEETIAKRVYRENWTKIKGSEETTFKNNTTDFYWNGVPCLAGEYQKKVGEIVEEQLFKQITNPIYFNSTMKWPERRDTLVKMGGNITDETIADTTPAFRELMDSIRGKKTLEGYKKEIAAKKLLLKTQIANIPVAIKELIRSNPKVEDWTAIETEIAAKQKTIAEIDIEISDINKALESELLEIKTKQNAATDAVRKMADIKINLSKKSYTDASIANKDLNEAKYNLGVVRDQLKETIKAKADLVLKKIAAQQQLNTLRENWGKENEKVLIFDETKCICPTCNRALEAATIEEKRVTMAADFATNKDNVLLSINTAGKLKAKEEAGILEGIETATTEIAKLEEKQKELVWAETTKAAEPKAIETLLQDDTQYQALKIISEQKIETKTPDISEQNERKLTAQASITILNDLLSDKKQIVKNDARVLELKAEEKTYAQELAGFEKIEFTIDAFYKAKMEAVNDSVNGRFKLVTFKLFDVQGNGGETPCCEVMINNVPFADLNHADQINAGVDVINALSDFYGVSAPITIDNAEAINTILPTTAQIIKLYVTKDPQLTFTNN